MQHSYTLLAERTRLCVLISYFGLPLIFVINTLLWPSCNRSPNLVIGLIHILPMLLFLSGVLKGKVRTHVWLSFISLGYFLAAVPAVFACFSILLIIETVLIVQLFIAAMLYVRWRSRELALIQSSLME